MLFNEFNKSCFVRYWTLAELILPEFYSATEINKALYVYKRPKNSALHFLAFAKVHNEDYVPAD